MKTENSFRMTVILIAVQFMMVFPTLQAQTIKNGNFENWDSINYKEGIGYFLWLSSNYKSLSKFQEPTLFAIPTKLGYPGDSGARLKTLVNGLDTVIGYFTNATQMPLSTQGGCKCFSWSNSGIGIRYKYTTTGNDSAYLIVVYKRVGIEMQRDSFAIPKTNGIISKTLSFGPTFNPPNVPDSVFFYCSSSLPYRKGNITNNSELELYTLGVGPNVMACDFFFTSWHKKTHYAFPGWKIWKGYGTLSREVELGNGALALSGRINEAGGYEGYGVRNYQTRDNGIPVGGAAFSGSTDTLLGFYGFKGNNTLAKARLRLMLYKQDSLILEIFRDFSATLKPYQFFQIPFHSSVQADTLRIEISSLDSTNKIGDTLFIDEIQLASSRLRTGLAKNNFHSASGMLWYPNPVSDFLYSDQTTGRVSVQKLQVLDIQGKELMHVLVPDGTIPPLSFRDLSPGVYLINTFLTDGQVLTSKIIKN